MLLIGYYILRKHCKSVIASANNVSSLEGFILLRFHQQHISPVAFSSASQSAALHYTTKDRLNYSTLQTHHFMAWNNVKQILSQHSARVAGTAATTHPLRPASIFEWLRKGWCASKSLNSCSRTPRSTWTLGKSCLHDFLQIYINPCVCVCLRLCVCVLYVSHGNAIMHRKPCASIARLKHARRLFLICVKAAAAAAFIVSAFLRS